MRNAAAELVRLISAVENGEREFIVGLVGYDEEEKLIACQTLDENGDGVANVQFSLNDCAFVKLYDDGDLEEELAGAKFD